MLACDAAQLRFTCARIDALHSFASSLYLIVRAAPVHRAMPRRVRVRTSCASKHASTAAHALLASSAGCCAAFLLALRAARAAPRQADSLCAC
jgi:hypothetical protein